MMLVIENVLTQFKRFYSEVKRVEVLRENPNSEISVIQGFSSTNRWRINSEKFWLTVEC